jgi:2'-5' RNA ligase
MAPPEAAPPPGPSASPDGPAPGARWFIALWPDPATRAAIATLSRPLIPRGARPTHPEDLHLTLRFLGPLDPGVLDRVAAEVQGFEAPAVDLAIDRIGHFRRSRTLWCGPRETPPGLAALAARVEGLAVAAGLSPEPRPFRPHITLARKVGPAPGGLLGTWPREVHWSATELVLAAGVASAAAPGAARYRVHRLRRLEPEA